MSRWQEPPPHPCCHMYNWPYQPLHRPYSSSRSQYSAFRIRRLSIFMPYMTPLAPEIPITMRFVIIGPTLSLFSCLSFHGVVFIHRIC
jgi:hypothetical protein